MATAPNPEALREPLTLAPKPAIHDKLSKSPGKIGMIGFGIVLIIGVIYSAYPRKHHARALLRHGF